MNLILDQHLRRKTDTLNIHYILSPEGFAKVTTEQYRRKTGERKPTKKGTKPPRSRAGQTYPGGRELRKALRALGRRQNAHIALTGTTAKGRVINPLAFQKPGSMRVKRS